MLATILDWLAFWRPPCMARIVIVNFVNDADLAIRGVLWQSRGPWLVLKSAEILKPNLAPAPADGDLVIHRDRVAFLQRLP